MATKKIPSEPITFMLMDHMHNPNSPFSIEDTEGRTQAIMSVRDKWMLPGRQTIQVYAEDGSVQTREIRYLSNATSIFVDEQIKAGLKFELKPKYNELLDLQFEAGELVATKNLQKQFLLATAFNNAFPKELRMPEQYACFEEFKPAVEEAANLEEFELNVTAANKIIAMSRDEAAEALMLWNPTGHVPETMTVGSIKLRLREIINEKHPRTGQVGAQFIIDGTKKSEDKTRLIVTKALAAEIISLSDIPGSAALKGKNGKFEPLCTVAEEGGLELKTTRFIEWLEETKDGQTAIAVIESMLKVKENPKKNVVKGGKEEVKTDSNQGGEQ